MDGLKLVGVEPKPASGYVELTARSTFSFLQAASSPEDLVLRAVELDYHAIGLADRDGLYGIVRAHEEAKKHGIRLVVGCELTIEDENGASGARPLPTLVVHVENHGGYTNLCKILTLSHARHTKGKARTPEEGVPRNCFAGIPLSVVCEHAEGLWAMALPSSASSKMEDDRSHSMLKDAFGGRASLGVYRHLEGGDRSRIERAVEASRSFGIPICAVNAVRYVRREAKPIFDVVQCIREGTTLDQAGRTLSPNAEAHMKSELEIRRLFAEAPPFRMGKVDEGGAWLARSCVIADACRFSMSELKYHFPCELEQPAFAGESPNQAIRRLTYEGAQARYPEGIPEKIILQIEKELELIREIDVAPYFLSVQSIVNIARRRDILCQGRGSAANSAVCYCLGITAVDPSRSNMLFERFLSVERKEPPDIDVDFEHERREEVIQELYKRYGRERAAMVSEVICYRGKSALREVGKVFGLSLEQVDRLSTLVEWWDKLGDIDGPRLRAAGFDEGDARVAHVLAMTRAIQGFPSHLSIHVGGFVLSAEPIVHVAPVEPATMAHRTVIPWDKDDLDALGFFKVDVLALGILTAIRKALAMVHREASPPVGVSLEPHPKAIDQLAAIPPEDPIVYEALCHADTVGVFQIESRAQMAMLPRLLPRKFYDLVVEVAIVRPGPIQGGMVHPYLRRRNGEEKSDPPHPSLAPILERTLGVPLFQEQVMQIAIVGAGYTGGEADRLRRDMAAWRRNGKLAQHKERLREGFLARGITNEFAEKLYAQIQGFGEYGFPESHAASFAMLVYASAWLKVHHPAAFAAALINSQPMGFYSTSTILQDAQKHGVEVRPICIERSNWDCTLEERTNMKLGREEEMLNQTSSDLPVFQCHSPAIRVGLRQVKGLGQEAGKRIEAARTKKKLEGVEDLAARAILKRDEMEALAEAGTLEALVRGRREAIWKVRAPRGDELYAGRDYDGAPPPPMPSLSRAEQLALDYERTGLSVSDHPMRLARPSLSARIKSSREIAGLTQGTRVSGAGLVICRQRPGTASGVVFITMEDEAGFINLILYSKVFDEFRYVATTSALLLAHGVIEREGEVVYIVVQRLEKLALKSLRNKLENVSMSRDFH